MIREMNKQDAVPFFDTGCFLLDGKHSFCFITSTVHRFIDNGSYDMCEGTKDLN